MSASTINSDLEINKRLLRAFSVESLKEIFNLTNSKERQAGLLNIILSSNSSTIINNTIFKNFSLLKQHVYIYEFAGTFNENWLDSHPSYISTQRIDRHNYIFNLLIPVTFQGFNKTKGIMENFIFHLPVQIYRKRKILIFHINILERDLASITTDKIIGASKDLKDIDILDDLLSCAQPTILIKYDLNKGVKELWKTDEIDALKVKYKNSKSTSQEIMDEDNMIKKEMPALYVSLITKPLNITTFRILKQTNMMHFFNIDPSRGYFTFNIFPKHLNGTTDLIDLVLNNN
jgi:hypothetical protein